MQTILSQILIVLYSAYLILLSMNYFLLYPVPDFFNKIFQVFIVLTFFISSLLTGKRINLFTKIIYNSDLEENIFSLGLGIGFYILLTFICGVLGLYYNFLFWLFLLVPVFIFNRELKISIRKTNEILKGIFSHDWNILNFVLFIIICLCGIFIFVSCFAPPTYYDSLVYHLALPQMYITAKKIIFVPFNLYSHFPQNMEMLYLIGLLLGGEITPNIITFGLTVLLMAACFSFCRTFFKDVRISGLTAVFMLITMPFVLLLSSSSYIEMGLSFYTFLAVYSISLFLKVDKADKSGNGINHIFLTGIFCGLAAGIKYTGFITLFCMNFILILKAIKVKNLLAGIKNIFLVNLVALLFFLPWGIKKYDKCG